MDGILHDMGKDEARMALYDTYTQKSGLSYESANVRGKICVLVLFSYDSI